MAWALRINPPLESRGMYLCVFVMRHYRDQRPSHTGTNVQRHAEPVKETPTHHHSGLTHTQTLTNALDCGGDGEISVRIVEICCLVLL